jgi:HAD superfamily hydrolase (TIGR01548 family)
MHSGRSRPADLSQPSLIIFDVDGVLVDTRGSFQRTTLQIVQLFTGKRVTRAELHRWKNRPGFNDDWKLSHAWVRALGADYSYGEIKRRFMELYWGTNGCGNVARERWLLAKPMLQKLARSAELAIFTGRTIHELNYTLDRNRVEKFFSPIVTMETVKKGKPDPEGLFAILNGRPASSALYVGDNVDDALAARSARMPFVGVLPVRSEERRQRAARLQRLGALTILDAVSDLAVWLRKQKLRKL